MPAAVISGLTDYITSTLGITTWDGEVPRRDTDDSTITPTSGVTDWPAVQVQVPEPGLDREWNFEDTYHDHGNVTIDVWGTTRQQVETTLTNIEVLLANSTNYPTINMGANSEVFQMMMLRWFCKQEENVRTQLSELLYHGQMSYEIRINGVVATR